MKKSHIPFVVVMFVFLIVASLPPLIQYVGQMEYTRSKNEGARILANNLEDLLTVNVDDFTNATELAKQINTVIGEFNVALETDFPTLDLDQSTLQETQEYVPLIPPYNELIRSAQEFDVKDPDSVNQLYVDAYILGAEVALIEGKIASEATPNIEGYADHLLKLGRLRVICGSECYSHVLSKIHNFIEDYAIDFPGLQETLDQLDTAGSPQAMQ